MSFQVNKQLLSLVGAAVVDNNHLEVIVLLVEYGRQKLAQILAFVLCANYDRDARR